MAAIPNLDLLTSVDSDVDAEFICAMMNDEKKFRDILSVIRQTGKCQNGGDKKTKHVKQSKQSIFFFSQKTNISYPLIPPCTYQEVRNVCFWESLTYFVFLLPPF